MELPSIHIENETGRLKSVVLHKPGFEVEKVTPSNAEHALYGDILNLNIALEEYQQFFTVLNRCCKVYTLEELFARALNETENPKGFLEELLEDELESVDLEKLLALGPQELFSKLVCGVDYKQASLSNYLKHRQSITNPLHNLFFTRDIAFSIGGTFFTSLMAKEIRKPEAKLLQNIFSELPGLKSHAQALKNIHPKASVEGGDVLVVNKNVLIIGISERTSSEGIDLLISELASTEINTIIVQELPLQSSSFIHLDMVFTLLDKDKCMAYKPVIYDVKLRTLLLDIARGNITKIREQENIISALNTLGLDFHPVFCGNDNSIYAEREQWHSGANFLALAPGKVIGYERNFHTNEALNNVGFEIIPAIDFIDKNMKLEDVSKCVITIKGSELARGGGGPRCMSLPLVRE